MLCNSNKKQEIENKKMCDLKIIIYMNDELI